MNLFLKIFLWFLAALGLMIGVIMFLNYTVQTEPVVSRWQTSVRNQMGIYSATGAQIYDGEGVTGLREFTDRLKRADTITEVDVVDAKGQILFADVEDISSYSELISLAVQTNDVQVTTNEPNSALAARAFSTAAGENFVLIVRWARPQPVRVFGESHMRHLRLIGLLLTALVVCYALARYLSSPIGKIRRATQKLAAGDLRTRVGDEVGNRRDELAALAKDFDVMAERIESLVSSQKRMSRDISHELRSPLARMNVALELAKQKGHAESSPLIKRIETESQRLNDMISRLLTLSKLETGTNDFQRTDVNLRKLVEHTAADADFEAQALGKSVVIKAIGDCRVSGNESLLQSAIENVLRNGVRYTKEGTVVEVSLVAEAGSATITIRDHGDGVPDAELANLFKPFYRVDEARDRGSGGIGLGLAIAEQAIRAHAGKITARNWSDGLEVEMAFRCQPAANNGKPA